MKIAVSPENGWIFPSADAALSRMRSDVVPPAPCPHGVERIRRCRRDLTPLRVHLVIGGVVHLDRKKRPGTHVQRHEVPRDPARIERRKHTRRKMKSRRGRCHRAVARRIDRLIGVAVARVRRTPPSDVRRQRHRSDALDREIEIGPREVEHQLDFARVELIRNSRAERRHEARAVRLRAEPQPVSNDQPLGGARQRTPAAIVHTPQQVERNARRDLVAHAHTVERRRDHTRIVEHNGIARPQQVREIADGPVLKDARTISCGPARRIDHEQPRAVTRLRRMKRDTVLGKIEFEKIGTHGASHSAIPWVSGTPEARQRLFSAPIAELERRSARSEQTETVAYRPRPAHAARAGEPRSDASPGAPTG